MNDEIKEILEEIDNKIIPNEHWNKIKDYITNLQEENEDLKDRLKVMEHFKNSLLEENNIIDELENMLENEIDYMEHMNCEVRDDNMYKMINLIRQLKEGK